jgi:hypothetical protein
MVGCRHGICTEIEGHETNEVKERRRKEIKRCKISSKDKGKKKKKKNKAKLPL